MIGKRTFISSFLIWINSGEWINFVWFLEFVVNQCERVEAVRCLLASERSAHRHCVTGNSYYSGFRRTELIVVMNRFDFNQYFEITTDQTIWRITYGCTLHIWIISGHFRMRNEFEQKQRHWNYIQIIYKCCARLLIDQNSLNAMQANRIAKWKFI